MDKMEGSFRAFKNRKRAVKRQSKYFGSLLLESYKDKLAKVKVKRE